MAERQSGEKAGHLSLFSFEIDASGPERFFKLVSDLALDLIPAIFFDSGEEFSPRSDETVCGTRDWVIGVGIDPVMFDQKCRAALRAAGYDIPERNMNVSHFSPST